jgi:integrase
MNRKFVVLILAVLTSIATRCSFSKIAPSTARMIAPVMVDVFAASPQRYIAKFSEAVAAWRRAIAPQLSPSTVRQRESHLRAHILPRFGDEALHALGVPALQMFATDLRRNVSQKTVVHVLITISGILKYAEKSGMRTSQVSLADLHMGTSSAATDRPFFTRQEVQRIIAAAREPYRTMFAVA